MSTIPLVMSTAGAVATSPTNALSTLISNVSATNPGYTANLPGTLIEDISSTSVGAIVQIDQSRVDAINSVTPYGANAFVLAQLGAQFGMPQGLPTNTNVLVTFSGLAGYVIPAGFLVSDGTYGYQIADGGVIGSGGTSQPLYAVATQSGSWAVPVGTVTTLVTYVPATYGVTCTNLAAGIPGSSSESEQSYRSRVVAAQTMTAQGVPTFLSGLLQAIPGVSTRLVSILQQTAGWEVICGGGDPAEIAYAIYSAVLELKSIVGSATTSRNVTASVTSGNDTYNITYVNPPLQSVTVAATWNTNVVNFTSGQQVNTLGAPAIANYINGITVGNPINLLALDAAFQNAVASVLPTNLLSTLTYSVTINGAVVTPLAGTRIIASDPESYFYCAATGATVVQG